jgi:hypothetical protein
MIMEPSSATLSLTQKDIERILPRGLIIMARDTDDLYEPGRCGFPYPKLLFECGITKAQWENVCDSLVKPLDKRRPQRYAERQPRPHRGIAYELEKVLDIAAKLDQKFFRPKGIVMRLDSKHIIFLYSKHTLRRT